MERYHRGFILFIIYTSIPLAGLSSDIYVPALPQMASLLQSTSTVLQLSIGIFMLGYAIAQLVAGPLTDAYKRKTLMLCGSITSTMCITGIIFIHIMKIILVLRFIQGFALAFQIVPARAMIADLYQGKAFYKHINYSTCAFGLAPIIGPVLGGILVFYFNWQSCFIIILVYSIIILLALLATDTNTNKGKKPLALHTNILSYLELLSHSRFMITTFTASLLISTCTMITIFSPFFMQKVLDYNPKTCGYIILCFGISWFSGNTTNRFLLDTPLNKKTFISLTSMSLFSIALLLLPMLTVASLWTILPPACAIIFSAAVLFPNYIARALANFKDIPGAANALLFSFSWLTTALATAVISYLNPMMIQPLAYAYLVVCALLFILYFFTRNLIKQS